MSLYKRGSTWWIDIAHRGERIRQTTDTADRQEAQRVHDELKAELWQQKRSGARLSDALKLWLTTHPRSEREKSAIRVFLRAYPDRPVSDITQDSINQAMADYGPANANRTLTIVKAALNLLRDSGEIASTPSIRKRKEPKGRIRYLTPEEWEKLDAQLPAHIQAPARFALSTGLRQANVLGLQWRDVDLKRRICWIHPDEAKAGQAISVPLNADAISAIKSQLGKHAEWVFTYAGRRIGSPKKAWGSAIERAGITDFTWHDLRHTGASWHVMNGTPLAVLKELGGWSSMEMVMRYAHLAPTHVAQWAGNSRPQSTSQRKTAHRKKP